MMSPCCAVRLVMEELPPFANRSFEKSALLVQIDVTLQMQMSFSNLFVVKIKRVGVELLFSASRATSYARGFAGNLVENLRLLTPLYNQSAYSVLTKL